MIAMSILQKFDKSCVFYFTGNAYHNMRRTKYHVTVHGAGKTGRKQTSSWLVRLFLSGFPHRADARCFLSGIAGKEDAPVNSNYLKEVIEIATIQVATKKKKMCYNEKTEVKRWIPTQSLQVTVKKPLPN